MSRLKSSRPAPRQSERLIRILLSRFICTGYDVSLLTIPYDHGWTSGRDMERGAMRKVVSSFFEIVSFEITARNGNQIARSQVTGAGKVKLVDASMI